MGPNIPLNISITDIADIVNEAIDKKLAVTHGYPSNYTGINGLYNSAFWGRRLDMDTCRYEYNKKFTDTSEWDKTCSAVASTVLALLPSLLAFSPLRSANLRLLSKISSSGGFIVAGFTFGLPVEQYSTTREGTLLTVKDIFANHPWAIPFFGTEKLIRDVNSKNPVLELKDTTAGGGPETSTEAQTQNARVESLGVGEEGNIQGISSDRISEPIGSGTQNWTPSPLPAGLVDRDDSGTTILHSSANRQPLQENVFQQRYNELRDVVEPFIARAKRPQKDSYTTGWIYCVKGAHFWAQVLLLLSTSYMFFFCQMEFIWLCPWYGHIVFTLWLVLSMVVVGFIRARWERKKLGKTVTFHLDANFQPETLPPSCNATSILAATSESGHDGHSTCSSGKEAENPDTQYTGQATESRPLLTSEETSVSKVQTKVGLASVFPHVFRALRQKFFAPSPAVILLHPSIEADEEEKKYFLPFFIGYIQLLWLFFLSFLFGSAVYGSLFTTLIFVMLFTSGVAVSRSVGAIFCWHLELCHRLTLIEYGTLEEKRAIERVLMALPDTLVKVSGRVRDKKDSREILVGGHLISSPGYEYPMGCTCPNSLKATCPAANTGSTPKRPLVFNRVLIQRIYRFTRVFMILLILTAIVLDVPIGLKFSVSTKPEDYTPLIGLALIFLASFLYFAHGAFFQELLTALEYYIPPTPEFGNTLHC